MMKKNLKNKIQEASFKVRHNTQNEIKEWETTNYDGLIND